MTKEERGKPPTKTLVLAAALAGLAAGLLVSGAILSTINPANPVYSLTLLNAYNIYRTALCSLTAATALIKAQYDTGGAPNIPPTHFTKTALESLRTTLEILEETKWPQSYLEGIGQLKLLINQTLQDAAELDKIASKQNITIQDVNQALETLNRILDRDKEITTLSHTIGAREEG